MQHTPNMTSERSIHCGQEKLRCVRSRWNPIFIPSVPKMKYPSTARTAPVHVKNHGTHARTAMRWTKMNPPAYRVLMRHEGRDAELDAAAESRAISLSCIRDAPMLPLAQNQRFGRFSYSQQLSNPTYKVGRAVERVKRASHSLHARIMTATRFSIRAVGVS